jgi:glycosyltransferase involved in cell wall biosynthesis
MIIMDKLLTVVIPTYNVEKYIVQCLDSFVIPEILDQLEVLVIDDGSKDTSPKLAAAYEEQYPDTFRVIHKENGGHGSTINRGLAEASGKYFKVVDSDDWVEKRAFLELMRCLETCDSDVVFSQYYWVHDRTGKEAAEFAEPFAGVVYGKEYLFEEISEKLFLKMHGLTIKTSILRGKIPPLDEHCYYVDMEYVLFPVPYIKTVTFLKDAVYRYRIGLAGQSMSTERMQKNQENYDRVLKRLLAYYEEQKRKGAPDYVLVYLEHTLGRMAASRMKIFLSFPYSKDVGRKMRRFDEELGRKYPKIYDAVQNKAVLFLRKTNYRTYFAARFTFQMKERLKK